MWGPGAVRWPPPEAFESVLGLLTLQRAYYHCGACGVGFYPRDRALGLEGGTLSPSVLRMVGRVGAMVSFEEGHELLRELAGVDVSAKHVERAAEALGREVTQDERSVVEPLPQHIGVAPTLYLDVDGTGVPMLASELASRQGKQSDGSSQACPERSRRDEARKCLDYLQGNREHMRYAEFRTEGLCTSTGVVEAGCKVAIGPNLSGQAGRDALDPGRSRRHHCSALLQTQRPLR